jgi:hypothetical protein
MYLRILRVSTGFCQLGDGVVCCNDLSEAKHKRRKVCIRNDVPDHRAVYTKQIKCSGSIPEEGAPHSCPQQKLVAVPPTIVVSMFLDRRIASNPVDRNAPN